MAIFKKRVVKKTFEDPIIGKDTFEDPIIGKDKFEVPVFDPTPDVDKEA